MCMVLSWVRRWGGNVQRTLFLICKHWWQSVWVCKINVLCLLNHCSVTSELNYGDKIAQLPSPALAVICASVISRNIDHILDFVDEKSPVSVISAPPPSSRINLFFPLYCDQHCGQLQSTARLFRCGGREYFSGFAHPKQFILQSGASGHWMLLVIFSIFLKWCNCNCIACQCDILKDKDIFTMCIWCIYE